MKAPSRSPTLLGLPNEIILDIADLLGPGGEFRLSQTCRQLRNIFGREDWTAVVPALPYHHRLAFWTNLTHNRPWVWVCRSCCGVGEPCVHDLDLHEFPSFAGYDVGDVIPKLTYKHTCRGLFTPRLEPLGVEEYSLRRYQVLSALKLCRLGEKAHLSRMLLAKSETVDKVYALAMTGTRTEYAEAKPRIVKGRFLLRFQWRCAHDSAFRESRAICPHRRWAWHEGERRMGVLRQPEEFESHDTDHNFPPTDPTLPNRVRGGCDSCLTDYEVTREKTLIWARVWYDLGGNENEEDDAMCWAAHVFAGVRHLRCSERQHGTIEEMFDSKK